MGKIASFLRDKFSGFLVGISVGLGLCTLAFFVFSVFLITRSNEQPKNTITNFSLSFPKENLAVSENVIEVKGSAAKDSIVTVSTDSEIKTLKAVGSSFSTKITLKEGVNNIVVVSFDLKTGESHSENRQILYLKEDLINI